MLVYLHALYTQNLILRAETMNLFGFFPGLIISLQLLRGDMEQIRRENPMIFNRGVSVTRKLGFPDVIMPGKHSSSKLKILVILSCTLPLKCSWDGHCTWVRLITGLSYLSVNTRFGEANAKTCSATDIIVIESVKITWREGDLERLFW